MDGEQGEMLVIVETGDYESVIDRLRRVAAVTQLLPPRLALVALPAGIGEAPPDVPGVTWYQGDVPADVVDRLSAPEQLFVNAWKSRRQPKERPGNHLPWDAPGFLPPDGPPG